MIKNTILSLSVVVLCGCAKLAHLQELLTLKELSDEQDRLAEFVDKRDKKFEELLAAVKNQSIDQYQDKKSILKRFGEPVLSRPVQEENHSLDEWLYRYTTQFIDSPKVYFYFDPEGKLKEWQYIKPANLEGKDGKSSGDGRNQDREDK